MPLLESPAFLALTWIAWWVALLGLGWLLTGRRPNDPGIQGWVGLLLVTALSMGCALVIPLGHPVVRFLAWSLLVVGVIAFGLAGTWRRWKLLLGVGVIATVAALISSVVPSNYDLGLYHAGSIAYVREGGTVLGLANVHDRFGFSSSMWPLSAFLGAGLWNGGEFRLANGLILTLLVTDVLVRIRAGRSREPGTVVLIAGAVLLGGSLIQYPGRLLASSAQDWSVAVLIVASAAYLLDALTQPQRRSAATVAIVLAAMAGAMRPTGWIYAAATVSVLLWVSVRRIGWRPALQTIAPGVVGACALGVLTAIRDWLTSGWLLFPAGFAPLPVNWRYPDPAITSRDITAWARTPFQDPDKTLADSLWISGWLVRLPTDWAVFACLVVSAALIAWLVASPTARAELAVNRRTLILALTPSLVVLLAWIVAAPDPRFAWGPLLLIVLIPAGFLISTLRRPQVWPAGMTVACVVIIAVALARGSLSDVSIRLAPMPTPRVEVARLGDGTSVVIPVDGDQCWGEFPLCRPWYAPVDVEQRGSSWVSGFQPMSFLSDSQE